MRGPWRDLYAPSTEVSAELRHALTREIMKTEVVRVTAVIIVTLALAVTTSVLYLVSPAEVERIWHGRLNPIYIWMVMGPFVALEFAVLHLIKRRIALDGDIPVVRRYVGNLASRLEALNKELGTQCLISAAVYDSLGEAGLDAVPLGEMKVRGYERPIAVWRLG